MIEFHIERLLLAFVKCTQLYATTNGVFFKVCEVKHPYRKTEEQVISDHVF